jgi:hypothetical protein
MQTITIINHKSTKVPIFSLRNPVLNTRTTKYTTHSSERKTSINASLALLRNVFPKLSFFFFLGGPPPSILELPLVRRGSFHHFDSSSSSSYQPDFSIEGEMVASWKNCGDDGVVDMYTAVLALEEARWERVSSVLHMLKLDGGLYTD